MKKTILAAFILCTFSACSFIQKVQQHCTTKIETTPGNAILFCALCDSTATDIFKKTQPRP